MLYLQAKIIRNYFYSLKQLFAYHKLSIQSKSKSMLYKTFKTLYTTEKKKPSFYIKKRLKNI